MSDDGVWKSIFDDPVLARHPSPGTPGNVPPGADLRLDIGWDRFEQLMLFVAQGVLGLGGVRFRRYGVLGQPQHGIDLAGRHADGTYTVVQCKDYQTFTPADLRETVEKFAKGKRPFSARHLIVAVSTVARTTQLEEELADLQSEHHDLEIELWGSEQINDELRHRADIVSRFWTRETAETFCTGAPLPGVAAPPPNWVRMADQILLTPLGVDGLQDQLVEADSLRASQPATAAATYQRLADTLAAEGFSGHANVLRRMQLDALTDADMSDQAVALAAELAATALHEADPDHARQLRYQLASLERNDRPFSAASTRHMQLIEAAVIAAKDPLGDSSELIAVLRDAPADIETPHYQPLLVLMLSELSLADAIIMPPDQPPSESQPSPHVVDPGVARLIEIDDLITAAIAQLGQAPPKTVDKDVALRLRLARAVYNSEERTDLLTQARRLRLPRRHAALVLATQARREALDGAAAEAIEHWRHAVGHAIHEGLTEAAAGWLYAIRAANARYGPWTDRLNEELMLARALPKVSSGQLIRRVRNPADDARLAALADRPIDAVIAARRWLADCVVTGAWVDEATAADLLGDLYARSAEPGRAATCYHWDSQVKRVVELSGTVGDLLLPWRPITVGPWWQQVSSLAAIAAQQDLLDDHTAGNLLRTLLDLVARGRAGELIEDPFDTLTIEATKTACVLAGRGDAGDARALLNLCEGDIVRAANRFQPHDKEHVQACLAITTHHPELTRLALERIVDLAEAGTHEALKELPGERFLKFLRDPGPARDGSPPSVTPLTTSERLQLRERLQKIAASDRSYQAGIAVASLGENDPATTERAQQARDRILERPEPDGKTHTFGGQMVPDSYLVTLLSPVDQQQCLNKLLVVASDRREAAQNRQDALTALTNLIRSQDDNVKMAVHQRSRAFVTGEEDGSALDAETTNPHPLSSSKVDLGSVSLRAKGLRLALQSALTHEERMWVREQAAVMLGHEDTALVKEAAMTLSLLGAEIVANVDASLLVGHHLHVVRELAAYIAAKDPARYAGTLERLAVDPDRWVRTQLARQLQDWRNDSAGSAQTVVNEVLQTLLADARHSVRRAAGGLD